MESTTATSVPEFGAAPPLQQDFPRPIPWEDPETYPAFWDRAIQTFQLAFKNPMEFFERIPHGEGFARPWGFLLLSTLPNYLLLIFIFMIFGVVLAFLGLAAAKENLFRDNPALAWIFPLVLVGSLLLLPLLQFLAMLIFGGLQHGFLWMFGGTKERVGAEHTIRACTYAWAIIGVITFLPSLIPYLGILIVLPLQLAGMVCTGMGLARLHRTDTWRGIAAAFAPIILACCCALALWFSIIGAAFLPAALSGSRRLQVAAPPAPNYSGFSGN
jgi:hypothetical protein